MKNEKACSGEGTAQTMPKAGAAQAAAKTGAGRTGHVPDCPCRHKNTPRSTELQADMQKRLNRAIGQLERREGHDRGQPLLRGRAHPKDIHPNYLTHKAKKNKGDRPQSLYRNHHEAIVSREDFIAVQHLLDNAKYGNKSFLQSFGWWIKGCCGASWCSIPAGLDFVQRITCKRPLPPTQEKRRREQSLQPGMASSGRAPSCFQTPSRHP